MTRVATALLLGLSLCLASFAASAHQPAMADATRSIAAEHHAPHDCGSAKACGTAALCAWLCSPVVEPGGPLTPFPGIAAPGRHAPAPDEIRTGLAPPGAERPPTGLFP